MCLEVIRKDFDSELDIIALQSCFQQYGKKIFQDNHDTYWKLNKKKIIIFKAIQLLSKKVYFFYKKIKIKFL